MNEERLIGMETVANLLEQATGKKPNILQAAWGTTAMSREFLRLLAEGRIPATAKKLGESGQYARVTPVLDPQSLKTLWGVLTDMSEEEMDERIRTSRLYPSF